MGFRFYKSKKIGPVRVTASKSGISWSTGFKGFRFGRYAGRSHSGQKMGCLASFFYGIIVLSVIFAVIAFVLALLEKFGKWIAFACAIAIAAFIVGKAIKRKRTRNTDEEDVPVCTDDDIDQYIEHQEVANVQPVAKREIIFQCHVAGISFRKADVLSLGEKNDDYSMTKKDLFDCDMTDEKIYEYKFPEYTANLIADPENKYDKNAIKVIVDGVQIGFIPAALCSEVMELINKGKNTCRLTIGGGAWKELVLKNDIDWSRDLRSSDYEVEKDRKEFFAIVEIEE